MGSVTAAIKLSFAYLGLYGDIAAGSISPEALTAYFKVVIGVLLPPYLAIDGGIIGWLDAIVTVVMIIGFGVLLAGGKRELNTPAQFR